MYNWNLSVERQLPSNILARAGYVASHSSHLTETISLNQSPVGGGTLRLNAIAGGPVFSAEQDLKDINANYNSLQLGLEKRASHGLTVLANYTFSRSTDDLPPGQGVEGFDQSVYSARPWDDPLRHTVLEPALTQPKPARIGSISLALPKMPLERSAPSERGACVIQGSISGTWDFPRLSQ